MMMMMINKRVASVSMILTLTAKIKTVRKNGKIKIKPHVYSLEKYVVAPVVGYLWRVQTYKKIQAKSILQ